MKHTLADVLAERTNFRFLDRVWRWALISGTLVLIGLIALFAQGGFNFGLDFTGGTAFETTAKIVPSIEPVRTIMQQAGASDSKIAIVGTKSIRIQTKHLSEVGAKGEANRTKVRKEIASYAKVKPDQVSVNSVSGTWGDAVTESAIKALIGFFIVVMLYLTIRLEFKMALAAMIAVAHDLILTAVVYAFFGLEVAPATIVALLTILGFSLYDTVIVFDKIEENSNQLAVKKSLTYREVVNRSLNETLMRSISTTIVAVLPVAGLVFIGWLAMGAETLGQFALALLCGLATGAYSSIFVAAPALVWMKEREPQLRRRAERAATA
ncbi:MAG: protein translocase subunit SecF [Acidimicrobiia bacterium]